MARNTKPDDAIWFALFNEIGIIEQLSRAAFERVMPDGMSLAGFSILNHFIRLGKTSETPGQLASAFQVTKGAMTNNLQRLAALKFIAIKANPDDGRGKIITLTSAGHKARDLALTALAPQLAVLADALSTSSAEKTLPFLKDLRVFLDNNRS